MVEFDPEKGLENPAKSHYVLSRQVSDELFGCSVGCGASIFAAIAIVQWFPLLNRLHALLQIGLGILLSGLIFALLWGIASVFMYLIFGRSDCPYCYAELHRRGETFCVVCGHDWTNPIQEQHLQYGTPVPPEARAAATERNPLYLLLEDSRARQIPALALMNWQLLGDPEGGDSLVEHLTQAARCLPNLRFLTLYFDWDLDLGDGDDLDEMDVREYFPNHEADLLPLLEAYPNLEYLKIQADVANFSRFQHRELKALVLHEYLGPRVDLLKQLQQAELPALEHLELWFGDLQEAREVSDALRRLLKSNCFPRLRSLALRSCAIADQIAIELAKTPVLEQLESLNFSRGTLGAAGVNALLESGKLARLQRFDFHYHYVPTQLVERLRKVVPEIDASDPQEEVVLAGSPLRQVAPTSYHPVEWRLTSASSQAEETN